MSLAKVINKQDIIDAADQCVMCGLCLPHCPTYSVAQTEVESPRGRIALVRALYEGKLEVSDSISSHLDHCLTCMSCERVCPANIDYEKIIDAGRAATHKKNSWSDNWPKNWLAHIQRSLLLFVLSKNLVRKVFKGCIKIFKSCGLHHAFSKTRLFRLLPETSVSLPKRNTEKPINGPTVAIINSCAGDLVNDETLSATRLILSKLGYKIIEQQQTLCCGALHQHSGDIKAAKALRQNFISSFEKQNPDYLISLATGCGAQIKRYPELDNSDLDDKAATSLCKKLFDVNEFILQHINNSNLSFRPLSSKVYLHTPCSQAQVLKDNDIVNQLLNYIPEVELITFEDNLSCCGAGGMNTLSQSKLADQLIENKVLELKNPTANYLLSSNIGCALHFQAKLRQQGTPVQVCHPITLLAQQVL